MEKISFEYQKGINYDFPLICHRDILIAKIRYCTFNWHENLEILCIEDGFGTATIENTKINVKKGDIIIVNSYNLHSVVPDKILKYNCLIISNDFCKKNGIDCNKMQFINKFNSDECSKICGKIAEEINNKNDFSELFVKSYLLKLLTYLVKYCRADNKSGERRANETIIKAIGYIRSHINENLNLNDIADHVGFSKYYFSREFKKEIGMTLFSYINATRCEIAMELLSENKYTMYEIAVKCGFENSSYFSRVFKNYVGMLPSQYVKKQNHEKKVNYE